jgi:catechol 2,3-dioxygenase-like lactoylglutathione lyase family enzyme
VKIHHLAVLVEDLARAEAFYVGVLGLPILRRWTDDVGAPRSFWLDLEGAFLAVERGEPRGGLHCVALAITNQERETWRARLTSAGVAIERESPFTLYFRDPEGNLLGLSHYPG